MKDSYIELNASSALLLQRAIEAGITSPAELANLMGNAHVETAAFSTMHERMNYTSASRIVAAVGSASQRFSLPQIEAAVASHDPKEIAKILYERRVDLGNTEPGDGWKYHGRGYFQYTGRDNYARYGRKFGVDLESMPDLAADPEMAAQLAIAFWKSKVQASVRENVRAAARIINGGENGLEARVSASGRWATVITPQLVSMVQTGGSLLKTLPRVVDVSEGPVQSTRSAPGGISEFDRTAIHRGSAGSNVKDLQQLLSKLGYRNADATHLAVDGHFGANTRHAVESFQREHGLHADGVVGKATRGVLAAIQANPFTSRFHPHHALYAQALLGVHAEEARRGMQPGEHSERMAGALAVAAVAAGITRIDRVELNTAGTLARAVQVSAVRDESGLNRTTPPISTGEALHAPLAQLGAQAKQPAIDLSTQSQAAVRQAPPSGHVHQGPLM